MITKLSSITQYNSDHRRITISGSVRCFSTCGFLGSEIDNDLQMDHLIIAVKRITQKRLGVIACFFLFPPL